MELTYEQIKSLVVGYDHVEEEANGLYFCRFSKEATENWYELRGDFGDRSRHGAGIRFDFYTDSSEFAMLPSAPCRFDVLVDNILQLSTDCDSYDGKWGWVRHNLPEGEHRVTVLFPFHNNCHISKVELSDGATMRPCTYEKKILFYGDSITQGVGAACTYCTYVSRLSMLFNADYHNQAISGTFFAPKPYQEDLNFDPDFIVIAYGTNDWGFFSGPDRMELRSREYMDKVRAKFPDKKIFGITPLWRSNCKEIRNVGSFDTAREIARKAHLDHGVTVIEGYDIVPNQGDFFTDGLHPNNMGHACMADALYRKIKEHL